MAEVGVDVVATDNASAMFESIGNAGKASLEGLRGAASKAGDAFKMMGKATVVFNQALELGRKAMNAFRILVSDSIKTALNFRKIGDPAIEAFKNLERNAQILRARLGDVLIPIAQGLMDAFNGVGNSVVDWINMNRKLIATNIADWMKTIAEVAVKGVAQGILWVSRAWSGWLEIINTVKAGVSKFFALWASSIADATDVFASFVALFDESMAASISNVSEQAQMLADTFDESSEESMRAVEEQIAKQDELEKKLEEGVAVAIEFVGETHAKVMDRIRTSTIGGIRTIDEQKEAYERLNKEIDKTEKEVFNVVDISRQYASVAGTAIGEVITNQEDATKAGKKMAISAMQTTLAMATTEAAAKAIAAHTGIPFVGVAIGLSFAAAAVAAIMSYASKTGGFATGGIVRAGSPGGPAPIMAHDKERVLSTRQTESFERLVDWLTAGQAPGMATASGPQVNNYDFRSMIPRRGAELQRAVIETEKTRKRLQRRGRLSK